METTRAILRIEHVCKNYGSRANTVKALDDVSFAVAEGDFVGIMGASGSGKTTLLNCISTIDSVSSGRIYLQQEDLTVLKERMLARFRRENLGFIFQDFNLLDTLTIWDNIALAMTVNRKSIDEIEKAVRATAGLLNISDILERYPPEVSGGQKQRCACARALVNQPKLILADEPTGALDSKSSQVLLAALQKMNADLNVAIIMVTHDALCASYAKQILILQDGKLIGRLLRGDKLRKEFLAEILDATSVLDEDLA